jgi:hypothetical protein
MINNYLEFLTESRILIAINEGQLNCSPEFLDKLKSLKKQSDVADILYSIFSKEIFINKDLSQNFIDICDKEESITFLSDRKSEDSDNPYAEKSRGDIRIGRFAKSILSNSDVRYSLSDKKKALLDSLKDKDYEQFVNLYKATKVKNDYTFQLVSGSKIWRYYDEDSYSFSDKGTLGNSCMKHEECLDFFEIYSDNPEVCSLLVYLDDKGYVLGRALVWKLSESPCAATYFMDRIYTAHDSDINKFKSYADKEGWMYKNKQSSYREESFLFRYKGQLILGKIKVNLKKVDFDTYPFLDTLSFLDEKNKFISNYGTKNVEILQDTSGESNKCFSCDGSGLELGGCVNCDSTGEIGDTEKCETCGGVGEHPCNGCTGAYINELEDIKDKYPELKTQAIQDIEKEKLEFIEKYSKKEKKIKK